MNLDADAILSTVTAVVQLRLNKFSGLASGIAKSHIIEAVGPIYAEGFGWGEIPLWMTVHEITPMVRLTAWYELAEDAPEPEINANHPVIWIERPIVPSQVSDLLNFPDSYRPTQAEHLMVWPRRGLCLRFSRRSKLPTLLFAFVPMSEPEFDRSPMILRD